MSREIALIVAHDRRLAIGCDGQLPWHLPDDLKRFKALTLGHTVVMGRKTYESIGRPLPGRSNWVLSRNRDWRAEGVQRFDDWPAALATHVDGLLWVIGGGEVYRAALADVDRVEATEVDTQLLSADTWFPALDPQRWMASQRQSHAADARHAFAFDFVRWQRIREP